jgi:hypothetical protein
MVPQRTTQQATHEQEQYPNATDSVVDDMLFVAWESASNELRDRYNQDMAKWEKVRKERNN